MSDRKFAIFHCKILISLERQYYLRGKRPCLEYGVFCYLNIGARYPIGLALLSVIFLLCIAGFLDWCLMFTRKLLFDYSLFHQAKETTDTTYPFCIIMHFCAVLNGRIYGELHYIYTLRLLSCGFPSSVFRATY